MTGKEQLQVRKLIGKICDVCARINFETKYAATFEHTGSTHSLTAYVRDSKTSFGSSVLFEPYNFVWMDEKYPAKGIINQLTDHLAALEKFLADELAK